MLTIEERVSRLERAYKSATTKEDVARLERKLENGVTNMDAMENRLLIKLVGSMLVIAGLTIAVLRFLG